MALERCQRWIDTKKDARTEMVVHHALDVMQRFVGFSQATVNDRQREMHLRWKRGEIRHQGQLFLPVRLRPAFAEREGQRLTIQRDPPARLLRDDGRGLFKLAERRMRPSGHCRPPRSPGRFREP
jgi:hypothetical protein